MSTKCVSIREKDKVKDLQLCEKICRIIIGDDMSFEEEKLLRISQSKPRQTNRGR